MEATDESLWFITRVDNINVLMSLKDGEYTNHNSVIDVQANRFSGHGGKRYYYRSSSDPIHYIDTETLETTAIELPNSNMVVNSFSAFNDDLYISISDNSNHSIYKYDDELYKLYDTDTIYHVAGPKGPDNIWSYSSPNDDELFLTSLSDSGYETFTFEELFGTMFEAGDVNRIYKEDEEGRIWFSTYNYYTSGTTLYSLKNGNIKAYDLTHSGLNTSILFEDNVDFDCYGNLISTELTHINVFNPDSSSIFQVLDNRSNGDIESVAADPNSCRYYVLFDAISFPGAILVFEDNEFIESISLLDSALDIKVSNSGHLYIGTFEGLTIHDLVNDTWEWIKDPFYNPVLDRYNYVYKISEHSNGTMAFGTSSSLVVFQNGEWTTFDNTNSPINTYMFTVLIDSKGDILVYQDGGIYKYDGNDWEFTFFFDENEDFIMDIKEDIHGNYLIGTYRHGLLYWNGFDYEQFNIDNSAIPSNTVEEIMKHPMTGDYWLICGRGLAIWNRDDKSIRSGAFGKT